MSNYEREELVKLLRSKNISDEAVLQAFSTVERDLFVPDIMKQHAYKDVALPIGYGQTISQPYTVAFMTQELKVGPGSKVLEIGTGSGFQAAILIAIGAKVYSIERNREIYNKTQKLFDDMGFRAGLRCGDGTIGWSDFAPYDGIIVTAGGPTIPENLKTQLAINGRMIIPVGDKTSQSLKIITKISETEFGIEEVPNFAFVPLIGKEGWNEK